MINSLKTKDYLRLLIKAFTPPYSKKDSVIIGVTVLGLSIPIFLLASSKDTNLLQHASTLASVTVTVNLTAPLATSNFSPGISQVDNSLDYPWTGNDQTAVTNALLLIHNSI